MEHLRQLLAKHESLIKYFVIGVSASALDVILFMVLFNIVGTTVLVAHSISVPTSILYSFTINARHNFKVNDYLVARLVSFFTVCGIGYVIGYGVIIAVKGMIVSIGYDEMLAANLGKLASLPVVFVLQYILNSRVTFRKAQVSAVSGGR